MVEKRITHPLRTIVLQYDEAKPETDYEKQLLQEYIKIHDATAAVIGQLNKLKYEYEEHADEVIAAEKKFIAIAAAINRFYDEAAALDKSTGSVDEANDIMERMHEYHPVMNEFHEQTLDPLGINSDRLHKEYLLFADADDKLSEDFHQYSSETCDSLYKNYDDYSLDMVSYDDDEQELCGFLDSSRSFYERRDEIIVLYNRMMDGVSAAYKKWDDLKALLSDYYDDSDMLDSSLSDSYANGTGDKDKSPIYIIPPGDERVKQFRTNYGIMANSTQKTMTLTVGMDVVESNDTGLIQELIMLFQHYPRMIEKWIFGIQIQFLNRDELPMTDDDWKGYAPPMLWFNKIASLPCAIFFIHDHDARAYMLMGDLMVNNKLNSDGEGVYAEGEALNEIANRLFTSCWFFHLYCHNTGFNPEPYIEAIIADFDMPFTYEEVKAKYLEDVKKGIALKAVPAQK